MQRQIIIVTRDALFCDTLERLCTGQGCLVEKTESVTAASEISERRPVSLLVANASIENVGDGLKMAKDIHDRNPGMQCFLIIAEETTRVLEEAQGETWIRFLQRPISMLQFATDVVEAIKKSKLGNTQERTHQS